MSRLNWLHESSPRVFATRDEVRRFARHNNLPRNRVLQTLKPVTSAIRDLTLYDVAPDGSYHPSEYLNDDEVKPLPMWFDTKRRVNEHDT